MPVAVLVSSLTANKASSTSMLREAAVPARVESCAEERVKSIKVKIIFLPALKIL